MALSALGNPPATNALSSPPLAQDLRSPRVAPQKDETKPGELRQAFDQFVGETFYGQMLKALRSTVDKPAYFHGGRGEEVFQQQLDQLLAERLTESTAAQFTGPMFDLFLLGRPT